MITMYLNGKMITTHSTTLAALVKQLGYRQATFAAAVNEQFIPREHYTQTPIKDQDRVEIVTAMQGG